jgi:hypothetical protein
VSDVASGQEATRHLPAAVGGGVAPFDPRLPAPLVRRGLARLEVLEGRQGALAADELPGELATGLLTHFATALGSTLLTGTYPLDHPRPRDFTPEQGLLARACLYVCGNAVTPPASASLGRLGAVTDVVGDERRYCWLDALPLRLALNAAGEGNGGFRVLAAALSHPRPDVRRLMLEYAWLARLRLEPQTVAPPLLANAAGPAAGWAVALAVLYGILRDEERFWELAEAHRPGRESRRYRARLAAVRDPESRLGRYLRHPEDLLAAEERVRRRVEARLAEQAA